MAARGDDREGHDPIALHKRGLSDQAPVVAQLMPRGCIERGERRLPQWIARTQEYAQRLWDSEGAADLRSMGARERLANPNDIVREAATRAMRAVDLEGGRRGSRRLGVTEQPAPLRGR